MVDLKKKVLGNSVCVSSVKCVGEKMNADESLDNEHNQVTKTAYSCQKLVLVLAEFVVGTALC